MKIQMLEHFHGTGLPTLQKGEEYENVKPKLREWLIEHRKAVEVKPEAPELEQEPEPVVEEEEKPGIKDTLSNFFSSQPVVEDEEKPQNIENVMQAPKPKKQPKKPAKKKKGKGGK